MIPPVAALGTTTQRRLALLQALHTTHTSVSRFHFFFFLLVSESEWLTVLRQRIIVPMPTLMLTMNRVAPLSGRATRASTLTTRSRSALEQVKRRNGFGTSVFNGPISAEMSCTIIDPKFSHGSRLLNYFWV